MTQDSTALILVPAFTIDDYLKRRDEIENFSKTLRKGVDYGETEGTDKPTLFKAGAEQILRFFGLTWDLVPVCSIVQMTSEDGQPFWSFAYETRLYLGDRKVGNGFGSTNSREKKYRWRWVNEQAARDLGYELDTLQTRGGVESHFQFAIEEAKTTGDYGKPLEYWESWRRDIENGIATETTKKTRKGVEYPAWERNSTMYRVPNDEVLDQANTGDKMAQKRSFVAAALFLGFSEYFTQDVADDPADDPNVVYSTARVVTPVPEASTAIVPADSHTVDIVYACHHDKCTEEITDAMVRERRAPYCTKHYALWLRRRGDDQLYNQVLAAYAEAQTTFTFEAFAQKNGVYPSSTNKVLLDALFFFEDMITERENAKVVAG